MSASNNWNAVGRVGRDCEVRFTEKGDPIGSWSLAVNYGYGENAKTQWVNCSLFGKRAEGLKQYVLKGTQMAINGEIFTREYVSKDGVTKTSLECRISSVELLGSAKSKDSAENTSKQDNNNATPQDPMENFDDDIPF